MLWGLLAMKGPEDLSSSLRRRVPVGRLQAEQRPLEEWGVPRSFCSGVDLGYQYPDIDKPY